MGRGSQRSLSNSDMHDDDYEITDKRIVTFYRLTSRHKRRIAALSHADLRTNGSDGFFGGKLEGVSRMFNLPSSAQVL